MIWWLLLVAVLAYIAGYSQGAYEECPREIQGWRCKGDGCNHSKKAINEAKREMRQRNYWDGR